MRTGLIKCLPLLLSLFKIFGSATVSLLSGFTHARESPGIYWNLRERFAEFSEDSQCPGIGRSGNSGPQKIPQVDFVVVAIPHLVGFSLCWKVRGFNNRL